MEEHIDNVVDGYKDHLANDEILQQVKDMSSASSQIIHRHKRQMKKSQETDVREKDEKLKERRKKMAALFDEEAELGSDNDENDDLKKDINKDDADENEDGMDEDLDGFVVQGDDNQVIGDAEEDMMKKFQQDLIDDDKKKTREVMQAAIFGRNRKRRRNEVDGLDEDDHDDYERR